MKFTKSLKFFIFYLSSIMLINSCSSIGLLGKNSSWLVEEINGVGDFMRVYIVLQLSILLVALLLSFLFGRLGMVISIILHFIWIISYRDYGFFIVLLLFGLLSILSIILNFLFVLFKKK